ncbi:probable alpha-mannosidase At5g13980 [Vicia villosa]|uniref:probable alpha-mannosidase At5g13980 n=1 Tax=Vicia villosa TaxID=3911 RepID=UPI00273C39F1|nr:probable alpha-mannosidase At5g13980 [Vicia villosa]
MEELQKTEEIESVRESSPLELPPASIYKPQPPFTATTMRVSSPPAASSHLDDHHISTTGYRDAESLFRSKPIVDIRNTESAIRKQKSTEKTMEELEKKESKKKKKKKQRKECIKLRMKEGKVEKERRETLEQFRAESQRLLRETRNVAFKPVPLVQKPISSLLPPKPPDSITVPVSLLPLEPTHHLFDEIPERDAARFFVAEVLRIISMTFDPGPPKATLKATTMIITRYFSSRLLANIIFMMSDLTHLIESTRVIESPRTVGENMNLLVGFDSLLVSILSSAQIFAGAFPKNYEPPSGFYFEVNDDSEIVQDNMDLFDYNVQDRVDDFVAAALIQANITRTNPIMWTMGTDFKYQYAHTWYRQLDKLIHYVNKDGRVNALYSTPSIYTDAKYAANETWPIKTGDFFPYADRANGLWTGYFTSRPALKRYVRLMSGYYLAARQLEYFRGRKNSGPNTDSLADALAIAQHHDAITGTEKQHVANDYAKRMAIGYKEGEELVSSSLACLAESTLFTGCQNPVTKFHQCPLLNITYCLATEVELVQGKSLVTVVYNSFGWKKNEVIQIPVINGDVTAYLGEIPSSLEDGQIKLMLHRRLLLDDSRGVAEALNETVCVVLTSLVYEKQQNLRIMMKMHGLGDGPYWMISYSYFLAISLIYMLCFVIFGSVIGLKFFTMNDYRIHCFVQFKQWDPGEEKENLI